MKHKRYLLVVFLLSILVLASCSSQKFPFSKTSSSSSIFNFDNYKNSVLTPEISLEKSLTSNKIFVGDNFALVVKVHNKGIYKIKNGTLKIVYNPFFLNFDNNKGQMKYLYSLDGRSALYPEGEFSIITLEGMSNVNIFNKKEFQDKLKDNVVSNIASLAKEPTEILFLFEFDYFTELIHDFCLNPSTGINLDVKSNQQKECYNSKKFTFNGQGSPVAIKSIDMNVFPFGNRNLVRFEINVVNSGKGTLSKQPMIQAKLSGLDTRCSVIENKDKKTTRSILEYKWICEALIGSDIAPYSTQFSISMDYRYVVSYTHKLTIEPRYISKTISSGSLTGFEKNNN